MADDNRLLQVMLEEELGLNLETHEHPLKQALGALVGVLGSAVIMSCGIFLLPFWGIAACAAFVIAISAGTSAQLEKNSPLPAMIWNLAIGALAAGSAHFLSLMLL
jgi:VIT1/CCC1 family predicted Fe2+/Mn2+ transporter